MIFGKPLFTYTSKHHLLHHNKHHFPNYSYYTKYATQDAMMFNTIISILQYCYHIITILISTTYSYIYRYNLSIKRYNSQYRYKYIESVIVTSINNTEMDIYTVYSYHNYTIINTILVYSNFFSA